MKSFSTTFAILSVLTFLSITMLLTLSDGVLFWIDLGILAVSIVSMCLFSTTKNYLFLLVVSLTVGFSFTFYAFLTDSSPEEQVQYMLQNVWVTVCLILLWLLSSHIRRVFEENKLLQNKVIELQKVDQFTGLLSPQEFSSQAAILYKGSARRNEACYLMTIVLLQRVYTDRALTNVISDTLLDTLRADYDLITMSGPTTFQVFLQNTTDMGCERVAQRMHDGLRPKINAVQIPIQTTFTKVDDAVILSLKEMSLRRDKAQ
ncbi:hypothetical protein [Aureibacillus halotolerans]|uniref:GGDEF domain-containing protein n=1 Tax=Aureibacillus halotolerans TaxID=1508390 RepID=A0A4R6TS60_9BACI|nr:hypothetical protein [Aureibacillus halotolerans]TDQ36448.1 hypothetical protein EV213_11879 [Aureibacillus halotolerans]